MKAMSDDYYTTSAKITSADSKMLDYLSLAYGRSRSSVIRMAIRSCYIKAKSSVESFKKITEGVPQHRMIEDLKDIQAQIDASIDLSVEKFRWNKELETMEPQPISGELAYNYIPVYCGVEPYFVERWNTTAGKAWEFVYDDEWRKDNIDALRESCAAKDGVELTRMAWISVPPHVYEKTLEELKGDRECNA